MTTVWRYALFVAAVLALLTGVYQWGAYNEAADWEKKWAQRDAAEAIRRGDAVQAAREEEQRRYAARDEAARVSREQENRITSDGVVLTAGIDGLRIDAVQFVQRSSSCPGVAAPTGGGSSATRAAMVLTDLLERSIETNRELAQAFDRARNAGLTCERLAPN